MIYCCTTVGPLFSYRVLAEGNLYYASPKYNSNTYRDWLPVFPSSLLHEVKILPPASITASPVEKGSPFKSDKFTTTTTLAKCPVTPQAVAITKPIKVCRIVNIPLLYGNNRLLYDY